MLFSTHCPLWYILGDIYFSGLALYRSWLSLKYLASLKSIELGICLCRLSCLDLDSQLSVSKVWWPELSQLSLCSEFDKENSMEFLLNSLLLIHFTTVAMRLLSHGPHVTLVMWHTVTVTCDVIICHTIVTLWQSHMILSHTPSCSYKSNKKRKEI